MTLEPHHPASPDEPNRDHEKKPDRPPDDLLPLEELGGAVRSISIKLLETSDKRRLTQIISDSLEDVELLNQLLGCLNPLCEDPSEDLRAVHSRIYGVVTTQMDALSGDKLFDNLKKLYYLSVIAITIIESSNSCPRETNQQDLDQLLKAAIHLLTKLEAGREIVLRQNARGDLSDTPPPIDFDNWMQLYLQAIDTVLIGMKIHGFQPSVNLIDDCRKLAGVQFSYAERYLGPTNAQTAIEAELWSNSLRLIRLVANDSMEQPLLRIAQELLRKFNDGEWNAPNSSFVDEADDSEAELYNMRLFLESAEFYSMRALLHAQETCNVESFWREVLNTRPLSSREFRTALQGLAKSDASETAQYVDKLLQRIGSPNCPPKWVARYLDTLILAADQPSMHDVIVQSWCAATERSADGAILKSRFVERLALHTNQVQRALKKRQQFSDIPGLSEKIQRHAEKRGAIGSKRALHTLQELTRDPE